MPASLPVAVAESLRRTLAWAALVLLPSASPLVAEGITGEIVQTFDAPCDRPAGMGFGGGSLWLVCDEATPTIYELDSTTLAEIDSFATPTALFAFGLDHDGTNLWGDTDNPYMIYKADPADGTVLDDFVSPHGTDATNGVVWDGTALWQTAFFRDILRVDPVTGAEIGSIPSPGESWARDMAWVQGELWVVDSNGDALDAIYRLDPADGTVLGSFQPTGGTLFFMYGLAHDGSSFWLSDTDTFKIHRLEVVVTLFADDFESGGPCEWSARQGADVAC